MDQAKHYIGGVIAMGPGFLHAHIAAQPPPPTEVPYLALSSLLSSPYVPFCTPTEVPYLAPLPYQIAPL